MVKLNGSWVRGSFIGRGANGTVNLALNLSNGDVFAVKSVELGSSTASQLQALENEIQILKSLSSPHVVRFLGDDETASFRNLHMEYMPRGTAADSACSDEGFVRSYTWCLVSALSYLHSRGIVHCDVKGKNVLLGPSPGSAKLADFGSAAILSGDRISPRGSPLWMAPEVVRGEYQGPESDVWSLGCTVIEMVTGKPAWDSVSRIGHSAEFPAFPSKLSKLGCDFLRKCLQRDAKKRWTCDQLLQHPFICQCSHPKDPIAGSSPRCVLDLFDLNIEDEVTDGSVEEDDEYLNLKAKGRIRGLITGPRANWESDGWIDVRGTSSEYSDSMEIQNLESSDDQLRYNVVTPESLVNNSIFIASLRLRKKNVYEYCSFSAYVCFSIPFFLYYVSCYIISPIWVIILFTTIIHKTSKKDQILPNG
ncbi:mitogen-activated protein kinase kinase kinase 18-like [Primulina huaijiensis]|uniref:mitogen-activated protein kinase kinase kinase 18-like n=1 Tax=Primulina huaijiensis TaxID=1492673 RepID=UPI003CC764A8